MAPLACQSVGQGSTKTMPQVAALPAYPHVPPASPYQFATLAPQDLSSTTAVV